MMKLSAFCLVLGTVVAPAAAWWRDTPLHERGDAPYPYPKDRDYKPEVVADPPLHVCFLFRFFFFFFFFFFPPPPTSFSRGKEARPLSLLVLRMLTIAESSMHCRQRSLPGM